ncbi:MAG: 50S ribosomal protein L13 [Candidatus Caldatribacterium sp.]|uniref:50S ribosomal protein L13 n=1 Tax=Candidatus Caldatribacterium sp. TaxID=2282143 RepID=UPI0029982BA3|nr:50S ribosomal protein L13 [Candidatus Caldatribacterium sp.]MCX7730284.1 50S ribosomal protein L13 [Candidatus Caldatribacterium sp.]MDW8080908.1 50S ribosomal protein L13 [Candidatus Calescibacterium sp.]
MQNKTYVPSLKGVEKKWYVVDAEGQILGRLASRIATILMGKHKNIYTPFFDVGDYVIVINAEKVQVTGKKLDQKLYRRHSGYPGGFKEETLRSLLARKPEEVIRRAVWGMIPHHRLGRRLIRKLKVYRGPSHPHAAQNPIPLPMGE